MSSENQSTDSLEVEKPEPDKKLTGGYASDDERYLIDRACLELGVRRSPFIVEAATDRARSVLSERGILEQVLQEIERRKAAA